MTSNSVFFRLLQIDIISEKLLIPILSITGKAKKLISFAIYWSISYY